MEKYNGKYILWNEKTMKECIEKHDPAFLAKYNSFNSWIIKCDTFKLFILYHMGGIYADIDTKLDNEYDLLDVMSKYDYIFPSFDSNYNNYFLASTKNKLFFKDLYLDVNNQVNVFYSAGPFYLTQKMTFFKEKNKMFLLNPGQFVQHDSDKTWVKEQIYSYVYFYKKIFYINLTLFLFLIIIVIFLFFIKKYNHNCDYIQNIKINQ